MLEQQKLIYLGGVVIEITKFIDCARDYFNLAKVNRYCYELLTEENSSSLNEVFKRKAIKLTGSVIPNSLFHLYNLRLECGVKVTSIDFQFLEQFSNLKSLTIKVLSKEIVFDENCLNNLLLEALNINVTLFKGKCFKYLQNLKTLQIDRTNVKDKYLNKLKQLTSLALWYCDNVTGESLPCLTQLKTLEIFGKNLDGLEKYLMKGL
ncbi:hypothetical protein ABK040_007678 [Willaertia magna]